MRLSRSVLLAGICLLGTWALVAVASDGSSTQHGAHFIINAKGAGNADLKLDELAEGETRSFTTDEGKPIEITRTAKGYKISIDGKVTNLDLEGEDGYAFHVDADGKSSDGRRIVVMQGGAKVNGDGKHVVVLSGDGEHHAEGGKQVVIMTGNGEQHVLSKKITAKSGDGEEREIKIRLVGGEDGEVINLDDLEDLDLDAEGGGHVVVIRKKVVEDDGGGQQKQIEVLIETDGDGDDDQR